MLKKMCLSPLRLEADAHQISTTVKVAPIKKSVKLETWETREGCDMR